MFLEQLSDLDKKLIDYMRIIGLESNGGCANEDNFVSCDTFLRFWEENKKEKMSSVFGERLILKKKINITVEDNEVHKLIEKLCDKLPFIDIPKKICDMLAINNNSIIGGWSIPYIIYHCLFTIDSLVNNRYEGPDVELNMPSGSVFKLVHGCKTMKALGRLCKEAEITDIFEDFRIKQSQVMNEVKFSSYLCLSIHPLDYMTASYNNNNWDSCMNWEDGDYRRGVIEMMNSPYVIVAYLESSHNFLPFWIDGKSTKWNSKKWREFIIVSDEGIFGIKGYPFWNKKLEATALKWVRDLFSNENIHYSSNVVIWSVDDNCYNTIIDSSVNSIVKVDMVCGPAMYNDFYRGNIYQAILPVNHPESDSYITIDYSGESECVVCGETDNSIYFDNTNDLGCDDCVSHYYCDCCGDILTDDIIYHQDGMFCSFCYDHELPKCDCCHEIMPIDVSCDCEINEEKGIQFCIKNYETNTILTTSNDIMPVIFNVCEDCANIVFKEGKKELFKEHHCDNSSMYNNIIPLHRIRKIKALPISSEKLKSFLRK